MEKYKFNKLDFFGGNNVNCNYNNLLDEKDCIDGTDADAIYMKQIYEEQMIYQNKLDKLDRFLLWFYTYTSTVFNGYLIKKSKNEKFEKDELSSIIDIIMKMLIYVDLYNFDINQYKYYGTDEISRKFIFYFMRIYKLFFYNKKNEIDSELYNRLIANKLTPDDIEIIKDIFVYYTPDSTNEFYIDFFNEFIKYYCLKLNNIIINAPRANRDITLYRLDNRSHKKYKFDSQQNMNYFVSVSCSKYTNFMEYIKNQNKHTYCFMIITCKANMPFLFTNRETSYFGEHSFEIILPYNSKFTIVSKNDGDICGYNATGGYPSYWNDTTRPNFLKYIYLKSYLYTVFQKIDQITQNEINFILNFIKLSQYMKYLLSKKPEGMVLENFEPVAAITKTDDVKIKKISILNIIYDNYEKIT